MTASHEGDPPGRWGALAALAVAELLAMTTWFSASAVVPQLRDEWALSAAAAAWLTIAVQIGFVAGALLSAVLNLADRVPPRRLVALCAAGAALVNLPLVVAGGLTIALPLRLATGMFLAGVYPPGLKAMATWFRRGRGTALGVLVGALTLGSATPHLVNAVGGVNWRVVIVVTSVLTLVGGLLAEFVGSDGPFPFPRAVFDPRQAPRVLADRGTRLATAGYLGHMWELYAMWAWFAAFASVSFGGGESARVPAALAAFMAIGVGALGCWAGGVMGDRWGRTRTTALAMGISGTCALVAGPAATVAPWLLLVVGLVWGFTVVADSAQFSTMITEVADQRYVGTAVTLQLALGFMLTVPTIWLVPIIESAVSWTWAFAFLAVGPALGIVAMLRLRAAPEADRIAGGLG